MPASFSSLPPRSRRFFFFFFLSFSSLLPRPLPPPPPIVTILCTLHGKEHTHTHTHTSSIVPWGGIIFNRARSVANFIIILRHDIHRDRVRVFLKQISSRPMDARSTSHRNRHELNAATNYRITSLFVY